MMTPDIAPYADIIRSLAPLVNRTNFDDEFKRRTHKMSKETRFLVKMEIKRLAKPCIRSIDFRAKVKDDCQLYHYQGIEHYLHINGILHFEKLIKRYGQYAFGVYEGMMDFVLAEKQKYERIASAKQVSSDSLELANDNYISPCQSLLNYPTRKEERLNYVTQIEVFFADKTSAHASSLDISFQGLRIRLKNQDLNHKLKPLDTISIVFRGIDRAHGIAKAAFTYQVLGISGQTLKSSVHLTRLDTAQKQNTDKEAVSKYDEKLNSFVSNLFRLHKRRYKVNLDNVEMAVGSKIYEQSFANNTPSLPVFITKAENGQLQASFASTNAASTGILDYWKNEQKRLMLGYLLNPKRLALLCDKSCDKTTALDSMTVYCFHHIKDENIYFYSATREELEAHPALVDTFLSYGSRKVSWRVFKLCVSDIMPSHGLNPSSVPDGVSTETDELNRPPSPRVQGHIANIQSMVSVTDISNQTGQECYQKRSLDKALIKELSVFGHPRNKPPAQIQLFRHKSADLRRQTRYVLRTPLVVKTALHLLEAHSEDISISGLKLELKEAYLHRLNSKVEVDFVKLQEITQDFDLSNLEYRVKHISIDKKVLHLEAYSDQENSEAEQFFSELISSNADKLTALSEEEKLPGMSHALRAMHVKNSPQFCAYIEKKQQGFLPAMTSINGKHHPWMKVLQYGDNLASVDLSWLYQDDSLSEPFIKQALKLLRIDPKPIETEIYVAYQPRKNQTGAIIKAQWHYQLRSHHAKQQFIKQANLNGEFFAFSVCINKAMKPDLEKVEQELFYLGQHAIHKATHFEERMWEIAGCVFINDISAELCYRYGLDS